jgi:hypothetical protein
MLHRACFNFLLALTFVASANVALAAKPWGSPVAHLSKTSNHIVSATITDVSELDQGYLTFDVDQHLFGNKVEDTKSIRVRFDDDLAGKPKVSEKVVLVYSGVRKHPQLRDEYVIDPDGAKIGDVRGTDVNALFSYSLEVIEVFGGYQAAAKATAESLAAAKRANIDALLTLLSDSKDLRTLNLVVAETYLRKDLWSALTDQDIGLLVRQINELDGQPKLQQLLLQTALDLNNKSEATTAALVGQVRKILSAGQPIVELGSHDGALAVTALQAIGKYGSKNRDKKLVKQYLATNSPGVFKQAVATLETLDPKYASKVLQDYKVADDSHSEIKRSLANYQSKH